MKKRANRAWWANERVLISMGGWGAIEEEEEKVEFGEKKKANEMPLLILLLFPLFSSFLWSL